MKRIYNPTDNAITIWWGHTPYLVNSKETIEVEDLIASVITGHNDYKELKVVNNTDTGETYQGTVSESIQPTKPWDDPNWDPITALVDDLNLYVTTYNLIIHEGISESTLRDIVTEHIMSNS